VLSDAEALCSRVGILAKGRLVASGPLDSLTAFEVRGWELVVSGLRNDVLTRVRPSLSAVTPLGGGRFALELPLTTKPEGLLPELVATGAHIVSLNPLRTTLEDFFIAQVRGADDERVPEDDRVSKRAAS